MGEREEVIRERGRPSLELDRALAGVSPRFAERTSGERGEEEKEGEDWVDGDDWATCSSLFKTFLLGEKPVLSPILKGKNPLCPLSFYILPSLKKFVPEIWNATLVPAEKIGMLPSLKLLPRHLNSSCP